MGEKGRDCLLHQQATDHFLRCGFPRHLLLHFLSKLHLLPLMLNASTNSVSIIHSSVSDRRVGTGALMLGEEKEEEAASKATPS